MQLLRYEKRTTHNKLNKNKKKSRRAEGKEEVKHAKQLFARVCSCSRSRHERRVVGHSRDVCLQQRARAKYEAQLRCIRLYRSPWIIPIVIVFCADVVRVIWVFRSFASRARDAPSPAFFQEDETRDRMYRIYQVRFGQLPSPPSSTRNRRPAISRNRSITRTQRQTRSTLSTTFNYCFGSIRTSGCIRSPINERFRCLLTFSIGF